MEIKYETTILDFKLRESKVLLWLLDCSPSNRAEVVKLENIRIILGFWLLVLYKTSDKLNEISHY